LEEISMNVIPLNLESKDINDVIIPRLKKELGADIEAFSIWDNCKFQSEDGEFVAHISADFYCRHQKYTMQCEWNILDSPVEFSEFWYDNYYAVWSI